MQWRDLRCLGVSKGKEGRLPDSLHKIALAGDYITH